MRYLCFVLALVGAMTANAEAQNSVPVIWTRDAKSTGSTEWGSYDLQTFLFTPCDSKTVEHVISGDVLTKHPGMKCPDGTIPYNYQFSTLLRQAQPLSKKTIDSAAFKQMLQTERGATFVNEINAGNKQEASKLLDDSHVAIPPQRRKQKWR
jgi:hypothetical protein